jgi:SAM-dependent methyltransferase
MAHRYEIMRLDDHDFRNKSILDIGCSLGAVGAECINRGASKYIGLEYHAPAVEVASKFFKEKKISHIGEVLQFDVNDGLESCRELIGDYKYDYVFALSIIKHVDSGDLFNLINFYSDDVIFFEGHADRRYQWPEEQGWKKKGRDGWRSTLENLAPNKQQITFLGDTTDFGERPVFLIK